MLLQRYEIQVQWGWAFLMLTMSYVILFLKGSCNSMILCTTSCHGHLVQHEGWRTFTLYIMLYTMLCFRRDEIVQVVSLRDSVFSGQPKVMHKFALNLANHFEPQKGERKTYKSKRLAFSKWNIFTFPLKTVFCFVVKPHVLTFSKAQRWCVFNENRINVFCFSFIYLFMKIQQPTFCLKPSPLCSPILSNQSQATN